ncbi:exo2 [Candida jiufengensis]|uniref:exo2 n=1 Tax=Candida jiufengensis TaxID=497108 RepID=UPI00222509BA|nr:exo2 [Candida jiufengensis]KAI5954380.1 exo2 [Candida jiufengensis]
MGIPKFFRFISERWPLISQLIDENQIPEFDNLYLDMNSILHTCTHSNDGSITRLSDDQMYASIFNYIEHLFSIIKPQKTFYMAIDGVAPRAKMNQQRARRFRTAYEAELNLKKAIENGEEIPKEDPFDSNSITPGTEFMAKLTENLKYFIHKKITEDSQWSNIEIILSGHEVPGEGEHKIMEFIRSVRAQPDYDPNLRHCIYGLDADLIMLGLVSHDPHFALLREEVKFGGKSSSSSGPKDVTETNFFLLHLSLLREYLSLEFKEIEDDLSFEYDFERILDDFILIMYVIGNDFLPHLPDLHINKGAFPLLLSTFKQTLVQSDGYMNEDGKINSRRLNIWVHHLSEFEFENFEEKEVDIEWFNKKLEDVSISGEKKRKKIGKLLILKEQKKLVGFIKPWLMEISTQPLSTIIELANDEKLPTLKLVKEDVENNLDFLKKFALQAGFLIIHSKSEDNYVAKFDVDGLPTLESDEEYEERINEVRKTIKTYQSAHLIDSEDVLNDTKEVYQKKFKDWKNDYYEDKLHFNIDDTEKLIELTEHYIEGLQWVLYYYYRGCPSWNWYYKYHYAPRISDISVGLEALIDKGVDLTYDPSHPFKPFEQLMAVLPARSRKLMPAVYRQLMIEEHSPIKSFYPDEVDVDMNGKTATWEAVVLLDFVDEKKLIEVLKPIEDKLTPEETKRNSYGFNVKFIHNPQIDKVYSSPLPGFFHDVEHDKCYEEVFQLAKVDDYRIGKIEGARYGTDLSAGFPTLQSISFSSELAQNEVKIFNFSSKSETMILNIENIWSDLSVKQFAQSFVGRLIYSNWPFLRECKVVKVLDDEYKYESVRNEKGFKSVISNELTNEDRRQFKSDVSNLKYSWDKTKGVKLGPIEVLLYVQPVNGLIRNSKGAYVKTYSKEMEVYPIQLIVKEVSHKDPRFATRPPLPIEQEFPINSQVTFLGDMGYGAPAQVVGYNGDKLSIKISKISSVAEPNIGKKRLFTESKEIQYVPSFEVAKTLRINPLLLSKITSQFMVQGPDKKINVGLELKFESKRQKVLGYTRKSYNGKFWEFSPLAINLINTYKNKFPKLFNNLSEVGGSEIPQLARISSPEEIQQVKKWLKEVKEDLIPVSLESQSLTKFSFAAIEQYMENYILNTIPFINKDIRGVPRNAILNASESYQLLSEQKFELGDRVLYVQDFGKVPILSKGTVASIFTVGSKTSLGVIFDVPQLSGNTMNGKLTTNRGLMIDSSLVLNLTNKQFVYHSKASKTRKPMSEDEKIAKIKQQQQQRQQQYQQQKEAQSQSQPREQEGPKPPKKILPRVDKKDDAKPKFTKKTSPSAKDQPKDREEPSKIKPTNELLSLLRKKKSNDLSKGEKEEPTKVDKSEETSDDSNSRNPNAIKQVYNQIYSNVMNPATQPQPQPHQQPMFNGPQYGQPMPAPPHFVPNFAYPPQPYPQQFQHPTSTQHYQVDGYNGNQEGGSGHQNELNGDKKEPNAIDKFLMNAKKAEQKVEEGVKEVGEKIDKAVEKKED